MLAEAPRSYYYTRDRTRQLTSHTIRNSSKPSTRHAHYSALLRAHAVQN